MALAHPQLPSSSRETINACDYYIDILHDFALKVRERNPTSLDEALRISLQLEAWIRDTSCQKHDDSYGGKTRAKEARALSIISDKNNPVYVSAINTQISFVRDTISDIYVIYL